MDAILLKRLFDALVLPPGGPVLLLLLALLLRRGLPLVALTLSIIGGGTLGLASLPAVASALAGPLERMYAPVGPDALKALLRQPLGTRPQAIVVLGGGARRNALDEAGGEAVNELTLARILAGVRTQRITGLPIAVTGGTPDGNETPEAELMSRSAEVMGATVRWAERGALDTAENASGLRSTLQPAGVRRILLVTHAYHMPRAAAAFTAAGFEVVAVPTGYFSQRADRTAAWLPSANALRTSWLALHEHVGLMWYRWRGHLRPTRGLAAPVAGLSG